MKLYVKNMVSLRCILCVKAELEKLGIEYNEITLGEVTLKKEIPPLLFNKLKKVLDEIELYIIHDKKSLLIENIKHVIADMMKKFENDDLPQENYSWHISNKLGLNYTYLANLFSEREGITIEHFIIAAKIEKVKQLLIHEDLSLTQISYKLQYSSVAHLSSQFKKVCGMTPSLFKAIKRKENSKSNPL